MNHHSTPSPFFVLEDVIDGAKYAMRTAYKIALEHKRAGRRAEYKRKMIDVCWYRRRLANTWRDTSTEIKQ